MTVNNYQFKANYERQRMPLALFKETLTCSQRANRREDQAQDLSIVDRTGVVP